MLCSKVFINTSIRLFCEIIYFLSQTIYILIFCVAYFFYNKIITYKYVHVYWNIFLLSDSNGQCQEINVCNETLPCQHGTCQRLGPGQFQCKCANGYNGSLCQHDVDDCASSPCPHGLCTDGFNNYTCSCDPGYDGK